MSTDVFPMRTYTGPTKGLDNGRQKQILCGEAESRAGGSFEGCRGQEASGDRTGHYGAGSHG